MRVALNIFWLVLGGIFVAFWYFLAAGIMLILIITIPLGWQALKYGRFALWPFSRTLVRTDYEHTTRSIIGNVIWVILFAWWLAIFHVFAALLLLFAIIGIPLSALHLHMAIAIWTLFGHDVLSLEDLEDQSHAVVAVQQSGKTGTQGV